ncbi:MAG: manganese transporter [Verrucomicrobiaceae bacterium]|nr:manganese transporter [Verrucomicrobiaceae bacterium]
MTVREILRSVGPAIIVAAVVLGPGSILTSSKVGAQFGWVGLPVLMVAVVLMIGMVALSARLGVVYKNSPCRELANRLGRPVALAVAGALFLIVALFQSSNNLAVVGGLEPLFDGAKDPLAASGLRIAIVVAVNVLVIFSLYAMRRLYVLIEKAMKILMGLMILVFLLNLVTVMVAEPVERVMEPSRSGDWLALIGMVGTTFSVGGAFFQAYLVKEKGWGVRDLRKGTMDSVVGITVLGGVTAVILVTSIMVFHRTPQGAEFKGVADVARQLEPLFGSTAKYVFAIGILAGAFSSFLVNALIGGTVMADGLGKGSRIGDRWARHCTTAALLVGMFIAIGGLAKEGSTVALITTAQALTVLGIPALAFALVFLGLQKDLTGERRTPRGLIFLAGGGTAVACFFAVLTALKVWTKLTP